MMREMLQLLANGVIAGTEIGLAAVGFSLVHAVLKSSNFAIGTLMTVGAYMAWMGNVWLGLPVVAAFLCAFLGAGLVGAVGDWLVLRPLRNQTALTVSIASMAMGLVLENIIRFFYGNDFLSFDTPVLRDIRVLGVRLPPVQLQNLAIAVVAMLLLWGMLRATDLGKAMRAVADNPRLAEVKGIDARRIGMLANVIGLGLAGVAGAMIGVNAAVDPVLGFRVMLPVFAAAILGGLGSLPGALIGSILIGIAEELSLLVAPPAFRTVTGYVVILLVLLVMPRGLAGLKMAGSRRG